MTIRQWLRVVGVFLFAFGIVCLPSGGGSPKRLTSQFSHLADSGSAMDLGFILIVLGLVLFGASYIGPSRE